MEQNSSGISTFELTLDGAAVYPLHTEVWFWEVAFFVWYGVLPMIFPRNFTGWVDTLIVWLSANLKHRSATLDFPEKQYERHLGGGGSV